MKKPIEWHLNCLASLRGSARRYRDQAKQAIADAERCERQCLEYDKQILRAELMKVKEFDSETFGKKHTRRDATSVRGQEE